MHFKSNRTTRKLWFWQTRIVWLNNNRKICKRSPYMRGPKYKTELSNILSKQQQLLCAIIIETRSSKSRECLSNFWNMNNDVLSHWVCDIYTIVRHKRFNSNNFHLIIKPHNNFVKRPQNPLSLSKKIEIKIEKSYSNLFDVYKSDFKV